MRTLPKEVVILGTGGGALTIAAELGLKGLAVTVADLPDFANNLKAIEAAGGIQISFKDEGSVEKLVPVGTTMSSPAAAAARASLVIISVPSFGHMPFARAIAPVLEDGQMVIWAGEGGGAFTTIEVLRELGRHPKVILADTNSLPYAGSTVQSPGIVTTKRKKGGTYIAGLPTWTTSEVADIATQMWPWIKPSLNVWETLLINFNAIDHVATIVMNVGQAENRRDKMRLWGEGLSPGVARVVGAVDHEYACLRQELGLPVDKRYEDFLVEQGIAQRKGNTIYETMINSGLTASVFQCGPNALEHRFIAEDVPYSLVLASSLGDELGVETPVIDSLCTIASTAAHHDFWTEGRTLATWGLKGKSRADLIRAVDEGWW